MIKNQCLIGFEVWGWQANDILPVAIRSISEFVRIVNISSVYRVFNDYECEYDGEITKKSTNFTISTIINEEHGLLCSVVKGDIHLDCPEDIHKRFISIEQHMFLKTKRPCLKIRFLAFGDRVQMTPKLTLPDPNLYLRPQSLVPACEIWPDFFHPVLHLPLIDVVKNYVPKYWGEFYAQGRSVLDIAKKLPDKLF